MASNTSDLSIKTDSLCVKYQTEIVLENVSLEIFAGDYVAIVGPNGSGKTTFVKAILGLVPVHSGKISLLGSNIGDFVKWEKIGYLPQSMNSSRRNFPANVREIIASGLLTTKKVPRKISPSDYKKVSEIAEALNIGDLLLRMIGDLSGGQMQRVMLARALVSEPEILFLDEPTAAIDPATRKSFYKIVEKMNKDKGTTVLFISHDIASVGAFASKLLYLDKKVIFMGDFGEFCESSTMSKYFGTSTQHMICHQH